MANLFEASRNGITSSTGTVTLDTKRSTWFNQIVVNKGTATTGTLTLKYTLGGVTSNIVDSEGDNVTLSLSSQPSPVKFEGLADSIVIEQSENNGTFSVLFVGISS